MLVGRGMNWGRWSGRGRPCRGGDIEENWMSRRSHMKNGEDGIPGSRNSRCKGHE